MALVHDNLIESCLQREVSVSEFRLWCAMSSLVGPTGTCHSTDEEIAKLLGRSPSSIQQWLLGLERGGWIKRHKNPKTRKRQIELLPLGHGRPRRGLKVVEAD